MSKKPHDVQLSFMLDDRKHLISYTGKKRGQELKDIKEKLKGYENIKVYDCFGGSGAVSLSIDNPVVYNELNWPYFNLFKQLITVDNEQEFINALYKYLALKTQDNWLNKLVKDTYFKVDDLNKAAILLLFYSRVGFASNISINLFKNENCKSERIIIDQSYKSSKDESKPFIIARNIKHYLKNNPKYIKCLNKSYDELEVKKNAIYYLDPPYTKTIDNYKSTGFTNEAFFKWVEKLSKQGIKWMMHNDVASLNWIDKKYLVNKTIRQTILNKKDFTTHFYSNF